jgi:predicted Rossmann fold nucleotide-binding protein DprA/Smf involved in DNA uptake
MFSPCPAMLQTRILGSEYANQARRKAGRYVGRCMAGSAGGSPASAHSSASPESGDASSASLFPDQAPRPHEKRILSLLKADEATHIDELVERLENEMSSSEIFAALFELELTGKVRQMPGKNFVKSF